MTVRVVLGLVVALTLGGPVLATGPERSIRPEGRPGTETAVREAAVATVAAQVPKIQNTGPRPKARPRDAALRSEARAAAAARATEIAVVSATVSGVRIAQPGVRGPALKPKERPRRVERRAQRAIARATDAAQAAQTTPLAPKGTTAAQVREATARVAPQEQVKPKRRGLFQRTAKPKRYPAKGSVCGVAAIRGVEIAPVPGRIKGCGIPEPVRVSAIGSVQLSRPATIDCPTARALHSWVENGAKPAVGKRGGGVAGLQVAAHYACRTRNNRPGARISEHGRGRAIDISAVILNDGSSITVLKGWRNRKDGPVLKRMHKAACGPFGTVLGPNSDRYHQDHFHFDTARYRSGPYCR